ncbi:MAG: NUDIX domain-containing protein [Candidatus Paceibacterota bacterium]
MKQIKLINPENVTEEETNDYKVREAARAIVVDKDGKVAMLHVSKENYYKLPGGGVEKGEDILLALKRECKEEIGCEIEVTSELGMITECRKMFGIKQISYCYMAKLKGEKGTPDFTKKESSKGFKEVWFSYEEAVKAMKESQATSKEGRIYIVPRDTFILEEAKTYLK